MPPLWLGETAAIVASGPSLRKRDLDAIKGAVRVIAVNRSWEVALFADVLYAADIQFWNAHEGVPRFQRMRVTCNRRAAYRWGLRLVETIRHDGLSLDPHGIASGSHSGYQALNLAVLLGAKRIMLMGFDMRVVGDRLHWHEDYPDKNPTDAKLAEWAKHYDTMVPTLSAAGVTVINCTPDSRITCFPYMRAQDVV